MLISGKHIRAGDTVPFIICQDGTSNGATQRGYHIDEVRQNVSGNLKVDTHYYLSQQLLPVVSRLCEPLAGTDTSIIAEFLGVESAIKRSSHLIQIELDPALNSGDHKYDICRPVKFKCPSPSCGKSFKFRDLFVVMNQHSGNLKLDAKVLQENKDLFTVTLSKCEHCDYPFEMNTHFYFEIQLRKLINEHINRFYHKELFCDDHACSNVTRYMSGQMSGRNIACTRCRNGALQLEV